jgi:threonine synthase
VTFWSLAEGVFETNSCSVAESDEDMLAAESLMATVESAFVFPEGAACMAATQQLMLTDGWIKPDERVVILNTSCGIKQVPGNHAVRSTYPSAGRYAGRAVV